MRDLYARISNLYILFTLLSLLLLCTPTVSSLAPHEKRASKIASSWTLNTVALATANFTDGTLWNGHPLQNQQPNASPSTDPVTGLPVLKITYPAASFGSAGGVSFYTSVLGITPSETAWMNYSVYFPAGFNFNQGGKLPGIYGSSAPDLSGQCAGGVKTDSWQVVKPPLRDQLAGFVLKLIAFFFAVHSFTVRMMWRTDGAGEAYAYLPTANQNTLCDKTKYKNNYCNDEYGWSLSRGAFTFPTGAWTSIAIGCQMNTPSVGDGGLGVWVNGTQFGGSDNTWATPVTTYTLYTNVTYSYTGSNLVIAGSSATSIRTAVETLALGLILCYLGALI
ncbi:hypothetical protein SmJEL517_g04979 [Synchytrium microbalum]|uniref:Polysaccharide lyase 14 domain-containing protein n=1 Tax=Synchytrium microbalum TaxID=1806994 RepID=A0A507C2N9_9FUNG|nr:uncharacterized protein SmJEL517_g04979 [Synchytrium microbalum]TPX31773.1 hypothetical protein SmJEL517_g04979 [Synchytrium microbalum]